MSAISEPHPQGVEIVPAPPVAGSVVATSHPPRDYYLRRILVSVDAAAMITALLVVSLLPGNSFPGHFAWGLLVVVPWLFLFNAYGLYGWDMRRVGHATVDELPGIAHGVFIGTVALWGFFQATPEGKVVFEDLFVLAVVVLCGCLVLRTAARSMAARVLGAERILLVGSGPVTPLLVRKLRDNPRHGLEPVGALVRPGDEPELDVPVLGQVDARSLASVASDWRIDRVVVSNRDLEDPAVADLLRCCKQLSLKVSIVPPHFGLIGPSSEIEHLDGIVVIGVNPPVLTRSARLTKRSIDVLVAGAALILLGPLLLMIALFIRADSPGAVLFRQRRIGAGSRPFDLFKFRTMCSDAEERRAELLHLSKDPHWLHLDKDPRITRVGGILRRTSLDELPQLWNVLRGDMSLVGPRPLPEAEDRNVNGWQRGRLDLTPGITGLWQVLGRTNIPFEEMVKLDYLYVTNWSLWTDIRLLVRTVGVVLTRSGAN